jgi:hypothetical protein
MNAPTFIYIIEDDRGFAKIGCGEDPAARCRACATHSSALVRLVAQWPGVRVDERALHAQFKAYRHHGEWFRVAGDLREFVLLKMGEGLDAVETWEERMHFVPHEKSLRSLRLKSQSMKKTWADPERRKEWLEALARGHERRRQAKAQATATARAALLSK